MSLFIGALMMVLLGASAAAAQVYPPPTVPPTTDDGGVGADDDERGGSGGQRAGGTRAGTGTGGQSGALPRTGDDSLDWAQAGLALIAAGGVIVLATRQRNERHPANT